MRQSKFERRANTLRKKTLYVRLFLLMSTCTLVFFESNKLAASDIETKFRQIERSWIKKYGQSHPFAAFEKIASTQMMSDQDLEAFGCKKQSFIGDTYKCANGITVNGRRISKVSTCKASPFNMVQILERNGIPKRYASLMFASMERTWNENASYFSYKISNEKMCVTAKF